MEGDEVDLSDKQEFTGVMKNPFQVQLSPPSPNSVTSLLCFIQLFLYNVLHYYPVMSDILKMNK